MASHLLHFYDPHAGKCAGEWQQEKYKASAKIEKNSNRNQWPICQNLLKNKICRQNLGKEKWASPFLLMQKPCR